MLQFKSVKTSPRVAEIWVEFDSSVKNITRKLWLKKKKKKKKRKELKKREKNVINKSTNMETKVYIYKLGLGKSTDSAHHWVSVAQW